MPGENKIMDHLDAIIKISKCVDPKLIPKLINFIDHRATKKMVTAYNKVNPTVRNVYGYSIRKVLPSDIFYWNLIQAEITRLYTFYKAKFGLIKSTEMRQIDLLKYGVGGKYNMHTDSYTMFFRTLSIIINLNDEYEGGDLVFGDPRAMNEDVINPIHRIKLGAGDIVFFPSTFLYPHQIDSVQKGKRYSIVTWLA